MFVIVCVRACARERVCACLCLRESARERERNLSHSGDHRRVQIYRLLSFFSLEMNDIEMV